MGTNYYFEFKNTEEIIEKVKAVSPLIPESVIGKLKYKLSEIHIGKSSAGWKGLFHKTEYFSNMNELEGFYQSNKDNLFIKSEYGNYVTWEELLKILTYKEIGLKSSVHEANINNWNSNGNYYIDEQGYEWLNGEFS